MSKLIDFYIPLDSVLVKRAGNSCFVYAPLPSDPLEKMRSQILEQVDVEVEKIYDADKFHITLLYIEDCGLSEISKLVSQFMPPIQFEVELASLEIFDEGEVPVLVWRVNPDPALLRLQSDLYFRAENQNLPISPFSKPEVYKPHVTVAYLKGVPRDVPSITPFKIAVDKFKVGRDDDNVLFTVHLPTGRGDKVFVETPSESNGHTEITQSELKSILSGERIVYGPQRRILSLNDGPFSLRHGKHSGQEGVEGQQGGSAPGFEHIDAENGRQPGDDFPEIGITEDTWKRQPFDEDLAGAYSDAIEDEFGLTPDDKLRNATWVAPDGRTLAEGSIHEDTSMHAVSAVSGVETDDITITETQVIQAGLIRHTAFAGGQDTFIISGADTLTDEQKGTIRSMMNDRVDSRASKQIQSDSDKYRVGLRVYIVEDIPATLDPISRNLEQISGRSAVRLLGLKRSEWRISGEDVWGQLVVSTAPRFDWEGKLITESVPVERHGKHSGQEGVEGQQGGSAPGFTHNGTGGKVWSESLKSRVMEFIHESREIVEPSSIGGTFGAATILPDGRVALSGDAHENLRESIFKEFGEEEFPGDQAKFGLIDSDEFKAQGFVRTDLLMTTVSGKPLVYFELDPSAITGPVRQAMRDIYWAAFKPDIGPPNVAIDWKDSDGAWHSLGTSSRIGSDAVTLEQINRELGFKIDRSLIDRHGTHQSQTGVEGQQESEDLMKADPGGSGERLNNKLIPGRKLFNREYFETLEVRQPYKEEDVVKLMGEVYEWPTAATALLDEALYWPDPDKLEAQREESEYRERVEMSVKSRMIQEGLDQLYDMKSSTFALDIYDDVLLQLENSVIEDLMRDLVFMRMAPLTEEEIDAEIDRAIDKARKGPIDAGYIIGKTKIGEIATFARTRSREQAPRINEGGGAGSWLELRYLVVKKSGMGFGAQMMGEVFQLASENSSGLYAGYNENSLAFFKEFGATIDEEKEIAFWIDDEVKILAERATEESIVVRETLDEVDIGGQGIQKKEVDLEPKNGVFADIVDWASIPRNWIRKIARESEMFISPEDQAVFDARKRGERKQRGAEEDQFLSDVLGKRSIQDEVVSLFTRLATVFRHGKHEGQEGREGQQGGSEAGFTHAEDGGRPKKVRSGFYDYGGYEIERLDDAAEYGLGDPWYKLWEVRSPNGERWLFHFDTLKEAVAAIDEETSESKTIDRHGTHQGQEGREGEQGGSQAGFTHGNGGGQKNGNGDWNPEDDNTIDFGRKVALDEEFDEEDEARGVEFRNSANQVLREFYEKTGVKPRGLTITNSYLELADTIIEGQDFPGLTRYELAKYLRDRSVNRNVVGSYENKTLWLEDILPGEQAPGGEAWNATAYHEIGHWVHNDVLDGFQKGDIVQEIIGSDRYIDKASVHYGDDSYRLRREYVADMFTAMVRQTDDSIPAFHRWGLGTFNEREIADFATLKEIVNRAIEKSPEISRAFVDELSDDRRVIVLLPEGAGEILIVTAEEAYRNDWPKNIEIVDPAFPIGENPVLFERILDGAVGRHGDHVGQEGRPPEQGGSKPGFTHNGADGDGADGGERKISEPIFHGTGAEAAKSIMKTGLQVNFADDNNNVSSVIYAASDRREALFFAGRSSEKEYALITIDSSLAGSKPTISDRGEVMFGKDIPSEAIVRVEIYRRGFQRKDDQLIKTIERSGEKSLQLFVLAEITESGEYSILGPEKDQESEEK